MKTHHTPAPGASRAASRGMSLVELLVAITIGMLIVAAMSLLFANSSRSRSETERSSRNIENGRYAMDTLRGELQMAGYFAEFDPRQKLTPAVLAAAVPDPCATAVTDLNAAMALHVQGYDNVAASTLSCLHDVKVGTDVVVVRRAAGCTIGSAGCTGLAAGAPAFQASSCGNATELGNSDVTVHYRLNTDTSVMTLTKRDCTTVADQRRYLVRIYYVGNNDRAGDGIPTLKVAELGAGGFAASSLVQGVENLQIEYGLDTDGNGDANIYTSDPGLYLTCSTTTSPSCVGQWASVVSVKAFVLSRSIDPSPGYTDTNTYVLGRRFNGDPNTFSSLAAGYKRKVFQEVIRLQNPAGRRATS
jgi:type IV pilus assembly protein PilW